MRERCFTFGADLSLVGVHTEPDPARHRPGAPTVVVANVGLNHRVGPFRLWVELARELADAGIATLRFDLSGQGDSAPRRDTRPDLVRAADDMSEALDFLSQKFGAHRFALVGLCSGVDQIHAVALRDPRVVGAAHLDGYAWPTLRFRLRWHLWRRLQPRTWRLALLRRADRLLGGPRARGEVEEIYVREYPDPSGFARDLAHLLERGTRLIFIYAGESEHCFNHDDQFFDMLGRRPELRQVELERMPLADHVFSAPADRAVLVARLRRFVESLAVDEPPGDGGTAG